MEGKEIIAFFIFIIAAVSDAIDGYVARRMNQITPLGKFLDPLADKLLIAAALLALVYLNLVEAWVAAVIILRELFVTGFRFYSLVQNNVFSASWLAKKKTLVQVVAISILMLHIKLPYADIIFRIGTIILYLAAALTVYSGVEYVVKYSRSTKGN
jgi:CDP-diacylglycerol--glycerol-3-phosphate 3-phosphatidyltransferase